MTVEQLIAALQGYVDSGYVNADAPVDFELRRVAAGRVTPLGHFDTGTPTAPCVEVTPIQIGERTGRVSLVLSAPRLFVKAGRAA